MESVEVAMSAETIRTLARPIINGIFIGVTASSFFLSWVEVPLAWYVITYVSGLEWVSERAVKRYKELFSGG